MRLFVTEATCATMRPHLLDLPHSFIGIDFIVRP